MSVVIAQAGDFYLYAPLYVAQDAGIFARHGLTVNIVTTGGDDKTWTAILSGSADFGVADPTFVAISDQQGRPGKVVASIVNGVPFWGITFENLPAQEPLLKGHTVACFPAPSTAFVLQRKMFISEGLTPSIIETAFGAIIPALEAKKADIGLELEPNVSTAQKNGAHVVYSLADLYGDFAITGLTVLPETIDRRRSMVQAVVSSIAESLILIRSNPDEAVGLLSKRFPGVPTDVAKMALTRLIGANIIPRSPVLSRKAWDAAISVRVEGGDLKSAKDFSAYVDNSFGIATEKR